MPYILEPTQPCRKTDTWQCYFIAKLDTTAVRGSFIYIDTNSELIHVNLLSLPIEITVHFIMLIWSKSLKFNLNYWNYVMHHSVHIKSHIITDLTCFSVHWHHPQGAPSNCKFLTTCFLMGCEEFALGWGSLSVMSVDTKMCWISN